MRCDPSSDLSEPTKPLWLAGYATDGAAEDVAVSGNRVWVAAGTEGLLGFEFLDRRLRMERSSGAPNTLQLSWQPGAGWTLQRATSLSAPDWQSLSGSANTNTATLPIGSASEFFRLVQPCSRHVPTPNAGATW